MKIGITGRNGFIGGALARRLEAEGHTIYSYPRPDLDKLFLFGSPSSNITFDKNIDYCFEETINSFLNAIQFCRDHNIKLIYPSSATIYNKNTTYARCKSILEEIHLAYKGDVLGLRIFAGYGVGEEHKGEYASIVYQFCKQMKKGERPVIFGDGTQSRDFIYIDDIVENILVADETCKAPFIDVGTGVDVDFNEVVATINRVLETNIEPIYVEKPTDYISETKCSNPVPTNISLAEGIKKIINSL